MRLSPELVAMLQDWLPANSAPERPQLNLSTISAETGGPDSRTLLLSEWDDQGFYVHTDSRSRKVSDIAAEPRVALLFLWPNFTRQLTVQGLAELAAAEEITRAFRARSPYLKQLAWQNSLEFAQLPLDERVAQWSAFTDDPESLDESPTWTGYLIRPTRLTFWESNPAAPSRRTEYVLEGESWSMRYLAG